MSSSCPYCFVPACIRRTQLPWILTSELGNCSRSLARKPRWTEDFTWLEEDTSSCENLDRGIGDAEKGGRKRVRCRQRSPCVGQANPTEERRGPQHATWHVAAEMVCQGYVQEVKTQSTKQSTLQNCCRGCVILCHL